MLQVVEAAGKLRRTVRRIPSKLITKLQVPKRRRIPRKDGKEGRKKHSKKVAIKER